MPAARSVLRRRGSAVLALVVLAAASLTVGLVFGVAGTPASRPAAVPAVITPGGGGTPTRPNIVFVLTDDLSWNLVQWMPHVEALERDGMTFTNYTVTDSLCCPSRASIFTGDFPHTTRVVANDGPDGGAQRFQELGDDHSTFATSVHAAGYRTGFLGKYLNGYDPTDPLAGFASFLGGAYVPPGWDTWNAVDGHGYNEFEYTMAENHAWRHYGDSDADFLNTVDQQRGERFAVRAAGRRVPFLLEIASFAPHIPYVAAPQDVGTFPGVDAPRTPAFNAQPVDPPPWLRGHPALTPAQIRLIDFHYRQRVEAVQSVDRMVGSLEQLLGALGQLRDTVFVFSSDNGSHMGEYRLRAGKQTAFDTDVRVPLIVAGPGIRHGSISTEPVENVDLRPTFDELAGAPTPADVEGRSLVPLLHGQDVPWRTLALIEHRYPAPTSSDPDEQTYDQGTPPSYEAIRSTTFTFVRYDDGEIEYYDRIRDPYELDNTASALPPSRVAQLTGWLDALRRCDDGASCWAAGRPTAP